MLEGLILALIVGVVFVNGWTDAPNAIACAVSTKAMDYRRAAWMAGICNLLGLLTVSATGAAVTDTIISLVDFGGDSRAALIALSAAMASIILFAVAAWRFGIPTSESHALIASLTGAAFALNKAPGIDKTAWGKVLAGLLFSIACGYSLSWLSAKLLAAPLGRLKEQTLGRMQVLTAGGMAFMHGAQDGQKFVAVFVMAELLAKGQYHPGPVSLGRHVWVLLLCAFTMALGTSVGGGRIVELVGGRMVQLRKREGLCADLGGALCLLLATLWGIPMSTSHTKTTAMMGVASASGGKVDKQVVGEIVLTWGITFPVCTLLGWMLTRWLLFIL
ncbi:MAG: inorganic phosphate transporter [Oscillospiraceae bacterium]|jgi:PiT family inorganic phosphate transporter